MTAPSTADIIKANQDAIFQAAITIHANRPGYGFSHSLQDAIALRVDAESQIQHAIDEAGRA